MTSRKPSHAGSWYPADPKMLKTTLDNHFTNAKKKVDPLIDSKQVNFVKAIIVPHAGIDYCGETAACAYAMCRRHQIKTVFLLGPSHTFYTKRCHLTNHSVYDMPTGKIEIDRTIIENLKKDKSFLSLNEAYDESEHSIEMCCTYLLHIMKDVKFKLVPIVVGTLTEETSNKVANMLIPYFEDENTIFIISSDFCHWGERFNFVHHKTKWGNINESITKLDALGMEAIFAMRMDLWRKYLNKYKNTICGRNPISVLLTMLEKIVNNQFKVKWLDYSQSSSEEIKDVNDSSVSYASALIYE